MMRMAFQMDHPASLDPDSDTTLVFVREAERRGYAYFVYQPQELLYLDGRVAARGHWGDGRGKCIHLDAMDVVWIRQDPPVDMAYMATTYLLDLLRHKVLILNDPTGIRETHEKCSAFHFSQYMVPTRLVRDRDLFNKTLEIWGTMILKPLNDKGGGGVFLVKSQDPNVDVIFETSTKPFILQPFLSEVLKSGDIRVLMLDGAFLGAFARMPRLGTVRANLHVGGIAEKASLSPKQLEIIEALGPFLRERGLFFVGVDLIGDYLSEINVTSPTGIANLNQLYGGSYEATVFDCIEKKLAR